MRSFLSMYKISCTSS